MIQGREKQTRQGWWQTHKYERRSISPKEGVRKYFFGFVGWQTLRKIVQQLDDRTREVFLLGFFTGSRAREILLTPPECFKIRDNTVDCIGVPCFKKTRGKHYQDGSVKHRNFAINRREPLTDQLVEILETKQGEEKLFSFGYDSLYRMIRDIQKPKNSRHGPWWPHRLRAERASQLVSDYDASTFLLKEYFGWTRDETPGLYVSLGMKDWKKVYASVG